MHGWFQLQHRDNARGDAGLCERLQRWHRDDHVRVYCVARVRIQPVRSPCARATVCNPSSSACPCLHNLPSRGGCMWLLCARARREFVKLAKALKLKTVSYEGGPGYKVRLQYSTVQHSTIETRTLTAGGDTPRVTPLSRPRTLYHTLGLCGRYHHRWSSLLVRSHHCNPARTRFMLTAVRLQFANDVEGWWGAAWLCRSEQDDRERS